MREGLKPVLIKEPAKDTVERLEERAPEKHPLPNPQLPGRFPLALAGKAYPLRQYISLSTTSTLSYGTVKIM